MDNSVSHPLDKPIDWDRSILAMHDTYFRRATLYLGTQEGLGPRAEPQAEPQAEYTEPQASQTQASAVNIAHGRKQRRSGSDTDAQTNKVDTVSTNDLQEVLFEQWHDGKKPTITTKSSTEGKFKCKVPDCNKAFCRKADLDRHLKNHQSGPRTYDCLAQKCPRKGLKGFWRLDKFKDHLDRKHPDIEVERWSLRVWGSEYDQIERSGYRDVTKSKEHVALMRSKGFAPVSSYITQFVKQRGSQDYM
ncbi:MAG: hypothetical protein Q9166_000629 [cf. Caloplaca sp. 2 TL-2023]